MWGRSVLRCFPSVETLGYFHRWAILTASLWDAKKKRKERDGDGAAFPVPSAEALG